MKRKINKYYRNEYKHPVISLILFECSDDVSSSSGNLDNDGDGWVDGWYHP